MGGDGVWALYAGVSQGMMYGTESRSGGFYLHGVVFEFSKLRLD